MNNSAARVGRNMATNSANPKMFALLKRAWRDVEKDYLTHKLNSEHALQSSLYCALRRVLDPAVFTILVEPTFNAEKNKPDLIIRGDNVIHCVVELKFAPHYYVTTAKKDIDKLIECSTYKKVRLDILGPDYHFDPKAKQWTPDMPVYAISPHTLYVFGILTRSDDPQGKAQNIKLLLEHTARNGNFCLLSGIVHTDDEKKVSVRSEFKVEVL